MAGRYLDAPARGISCLPQGDAWAPACLGASLAPGARAVRASQGAAVHQVNFLGDRTIGAASLASLEAART
eukprot:838356-Alexandrium_andersonii.AAC.1